MLIAGRRLTLEEFLALPGFDLTVAELFAALDLD